MFKVEELLADGVWRNVADYARWPTRGAAEHYIALMREFRNRWLLPEPAPAWRDLRVRP